MDNITRAGQILDLAAQVPDAGIDSLGILVNTLYVSSKVSGFPSESNYCSEGCRGLHGPRVMCNWKMARQEVRDRCGVGLPTPSSDEYVMFDGKEHGFAKLIRRSADR